MKALRTILLVLTIISLYAICILEVCYTFAYASAPDAAPEAVRYIYWGLLIFFLLLVILSWIFAVVITHRANTVIKISRLPEITKLLLVPVFLYQVVSVVLVVVLGYGLSFATTFLLVLVPPMSLLGILGATLTTVLVLVKLIVTYLMIVPSTAYALAEIMPTCRRLQIHAALRVLYVVLLFLPLIDTISLPIIASQLNRRLREQNTNRHCRP